MPSIPIETCPPYTEAAEAAFKHLLAEATPRVFISPTLIVLYLAVFVALDRPSCSANVTTLEPSELLWLDRATFRKFLMMTPMLGHNLSCLLSARLRQANEQIQSLVTVDVECRVARQLIGFADKYGQPESGGGISIPVRLTQSDLANLVGATRESVNKIIVSYKERGYLSASRDHRWTIHNRQFLANRCGV